jgi:hypothetical protein
MTRNEAYKKLQAASDLIFEVEVGLSPKIVDEPHRKLGYRARIAVAVVRNNLSDRDAEDISKPEEIVK